MLTAVLGIHGNARIVGEAEPGLSFQIFREVGVTEVSVSSDEWVWVLLNASSLLRFLLSSLPFLMYVLKMI